MVVIEYQQPIPYAGQTHEQMKELVEKSLKVCSLLFSSSWFEKPNPLTCFLCLVCDRKPSGGGRASRFDGADTVFFGACCL